MNKPINLVSATSTENMVCRLVSEDGRIEMGVYPVIFGFRIRAGFVGSSTCEVDWCCGNDQKFLEIAYDLLKKLLERGYSFQRILPTSHVKPIFNDNNFMKWFCYACCSVGMKIFGEDDNIITLPVLYDIREEYYAICRNLGL